MRGSQVARQLEIICIMLDGRSKSADDLSIVQKEFGVGKKTIRRDLEAISEVKRLAVRIIRYDNRKYYYITNNSLISKLEIKEKKCKRCRKIFPIEHFYKNRSTADGRSSHCVQCNNKFNLNWHYKNKEKHNEYQREYRKRKQLEKQREIN